MQIEEKYCGFGNHYTLAIAIGAMLVLMGILTGCRSTEKITVTKFDVPTGMVSEIVVTEKSDNGWVLRKKGFSMQTNGFLCELTSAVDPNSGMLMPTVKYAHGNNRLDDIPMINFADSVAPSSEAHNSSESLTIIKSLWGAEIAELYLERKTSGVNAPESSFKLVVNANAGAPVATPAPSAIKAASPPKIAAQNAPAASGIDINSITDQAKDWISKPENQAQAKSWLSQAWSWISGIF